MSDSRAPEQPSDLIERLRALPPKKRLFLEERLAEKGIEVGQLGILPRLGPREVFPASHTQARLWFLDQLDPTSLAYHINSFHELPGELHPRALHRALAEIVRRHEILRTTFESRDGELVQVLHSATAPELPVVDLEALAPGGEREAEVRRIREAHRRQPLDLERGPVLRLALVKLEERDHVLLVCLHHILCDAWSIAIFHREIGVLYDAFRADGGESRPSPLAELPVQYGDFVAWQHAWQKPRLEPKQLAYWKQQLAGSPAVLELPTDRPRPRVHSSRGSAVPLELPGDATAALRDFCRQEGATLYMGLVAGFKLLLFRSTGQRDLSVGTLVAGRRYEELQDLIGFFANTLVLRARLHGNIGFRQLLRQVREAVVAAQDHQDIAFATIVEALRPQRNLSHAPLVQAAFTMVNTPTYEGSAAWNRFDTPRKSAIFDLDLELLERSSGDVTGWLYYSTDVFDATTMLRMWRHWILLVARALQAPDRGIWDHSMLARTEEWQLLAEHNDTEQLAREACLHHRVESQAAALPDAVAVVHGGAMLSYRRLNEEANRLARHLGRFGVKPGSLAGLLLERSLHAITSLVGVLKTGGAYVTFDPATPPDRLRWLIEDSGIAVLVTRARPDARLAGRPAPIVDLDTEAPSLAGESNENPSTGKHHPEDLAYVLYTSGSTGRPKGVACSHRGVLRLLGDFERRQPIASGQGCSLWTNLTFDVSVYEVFSALIAGGRLEIIPDETRYDGAHLARWLTERNIASTHLPAFALGEMATAAFLQPPPLTRLLVGIEPIPETLLAAIAGRLPGFRLINGYGPTEATVCATLYNVDAHRARDGATPIGRPVAGTVVYLCDPYLGSVPAGVTGEILIGGDGLARGYHGRPSLSAYRFVPDPHTRRPGRRLYRTGDLARRLSDGNIVFQRRRDFQVKVRGYRVEPGEVEAVLNRHPEVAEAVVVARSREAEGSDRQLVAYIVPRQRGSADAGKLRDYLRRELPEYMVPSAWVELESLPRTANDKVDRQALPAPETSRREEDLLLPRTELESTIAGVWQEVLGLDEVGVRDNFFDLGGHSLLLAQVRGRLEEELDRDVSMLDLFRHATVAALADCFRPRRHGGIQARHGLERAEKRLDAVTRNDSEIAVVGLAGRFPGARDADEFWRNLESGMESISSFSDEDLLASGVAAAVLEDEHFVKAGALLEDVDSFDAQLFDISPREAQTMDPQQRIFLEGAWEALENAGYDPQTYPGSIGMFAGIGVNYYWRNIFASPGAAAAVGQLQLLLGNDKDFLPTRTSYKLNLTGPSVNVQTACSTSLVATHLACQSLLNGECDVALAGGVSIASYEKTGYYWQEGGILSPDGHCRAFDAEGRGTVPSSGMGIVVLKRLTQALADGDTVRAVIKGSAINNDGHEKVGFTAPSIAGQAKVIAEALAVAGVTPESVSYVETHGSATPLGDPIEVSALKEVFGTEPGATCALGSVKTNLGHTDAAAGAAGLIKTVLALEHRRIPPSLHFAEPNPEIDFEHSPFYVAASAAPWHLEGEHGEGTPRRAGVSSFGLGGTNAHVVLEEAPYVPSGGSRGGIQADREAASERASHQLLVLSAASEPALEATGRRLAEHLQLHPQEDLADIAFTLRVGRRRLPHRRILVCEDNAEAATILESADPRRLFGSVEPRIDRSVTFLFPGIGDHYVGMARDLYRTQPVFRAQVDRGCGTLKPHLGLDLRDVLYPEAEPSETGDGLDLRRLLGRAPEPEDEKTQRLDTTHLAQPAVLVIELALARLFEDWGLHPEAMIGYSLGEYAAACIAGVIDEDDVLPLVAERAKLIAETPDGGMLAVSLPEAEVLPLLGELSLAVTHGPDMCVVAGPQEAVAALHDELAGKEIACQRLRTSHAVHSDMMQPIAERFRERLRKVDFKPPQIPYLSNVTGTWITAAQATDPEYWVRHLCQPVRFAEGLGELLGSERILLEVGPGQALSTSTRQHPAAAERHVVLSSLRDSRDRQSDEAMLLATLGRLWLVGAPVDWYALSRHAESRRIPLPTYPFERRRYWLEAQTVGAAPAFRTKNPDISDWFYVPTWKLTPPPSRPENLAERPERWLLLGDAAGLGSRLAQELEQQGQEVVLVRAGGTLRRLGRQHRHPRSRTGRGLRLPGRGAAQRGPSPQPRRPPVDLDRGRTPSREQRHLRDGSAPRPLQPAPPGSSSGINAAVAARRRLRPTARRLRHRAAPPGKGDPAGSLESDPAGVPQRHLPQPRPHVPSGGSRGGIQPAGAGQSPGDGSRRAADRGAGTVVRRARSFGGLPAGQPVGRELRPGAVAGHAGSSSGAAGKRGLPRHGRLRPRRPDPHRVPGTGRRSPVGPDWPFASSRGPCPCARRSRRRSAPPPCRRRGPPADGGRGPAGPRALRHDARRDPPRWRTHRREALRAARRHRSASLPLAFPPQGRRPLRPQGSARRPRPRLLRPVLFAGVDPGRAGLCRLRIRQRLHRRLCPFPSQDLELSVDEPQLGRLAPDRRRATPGARIGLLGGRAHDGPSRERRSVPPYPCDERHAATAGGGGRPRRPDRSLAAVRRRARRAGPRRNLAFTPPKTPPADDLRCAHR